jgi:hypothetical protein
MIGDGDCGEIGGMQISRGNQNTRREPAPAPHEFILHILSNFKFKIKLQFL